MTKKVKGDDSDQPNVAYLYMHARHVHPNSVRCSVAGEAGHPPWKGSGCRDCQEYEVSYWPAAAIVEEIVSP